MTAFSPQSGDPVVQPVPASVTARVDAADSTLQNPRGAVLSLGSNLGNRLETLQGAVDALEDTPGVRVKAVSPVYETEPWGVEPGSQPSYFNAVVVLRTTLPPSSLLERAQAVEEAFHRVRDERWGPRTLDVDIVSYEDAVSEDPVLTLPHPRAHQRAFVLAPWYDVDPAAALPGHGPVAALLDALTRDGVTPRADLELRLPE
ncbi:MULTISPECIES: 2-amino-4-hydroxy-6-hydroxymethyldihydropteridine diphosphokinase [Streptomyces]|jgi:2-amino-4-hydroxy-6-hydroxymethyldihydropteridine diphosphokinase|uniref:2-amino-4-hydroxy-6-hydroxymethyldihydropteridine diphosphokinase n=3 Tax=Streptomyces griseoaurantiacus TaxID=68213 RepID=F3NM27_9ACTN|nr:MULTISPECIES: 2-amino-4-hydroxy-6-hydroxymethyldihydropteridine diphosphokinase [Streptomyces]EGG45577.1 2-amino-4-hydroxy-6-hydroxymethyldihydr op teridinediphosphokinase [Streptomyces griseoaurantiacus M045]MBA5221723.1 2-amino-4-hydroxy-6-hydroxymethyldihydropteridine diphosphokinase [Streptomyces griseoaurantiacus]MCF0090800.1 2-amino-4-hydroxy-6-hydroxymethyldihydropteridine pyrophosphokinase [Streptomyces sp. MH192]MCF0102384.1 2-amino-4-hydroxy-6-hydroxymethyldihydropteridine pyrophos